RPAPRVPRRDAARPDRGPRGEAVTAPQLCCVLTIDVEDWYHLNYDSMAQCDAGKREPRVERNTQRLLELFAAHGAQATFFFLGSVAEKYPGLVRDALAA